MTTDTKCLVLSRRWVDGDRPRLTVVDVAIWPWQYGKCINLWDQALAEETLQVSIAFRQSGIPSWRGIDFYNYRRPNAAEWHSIDLWRKGEDLPKSRKRKHSGSQPEARHDVLDF